MIRFRCPQCNKGIKVPEERAGISIHCPRCKERCLVPLGGPAGSPTGSSLEAAQPEGRDRRATTTWDHVRALFAGMSWWMRGAVALVAGVALLSLAVVFLGSFVPGGEATTPWAMALAPVSVILLSVMLHGQATGCPSCGRWWVRRMVETEFVDRHVFDKGGVPFARATYRTTYECTSCRHRWSVDHTDEYKDFIGTKPKGRLG